MNSKNITILCIDDDIRIRAALSALFTSQGWVSLAAANVMDGLKLCEERKPDLIIIDYHMPIIGGVKGVQLIRTLNATVPILVLTVEDRQSVADEFLEAGANDFILKPIKGLDIIARINLHIRLLQRDNPKHSEQSAYAVKGIVPVTQNCIVDFLKVQTDYVTLDVVATGTGLAYQTVSRYLQHMVAEEDVQVITTYGKVGRPRQHYLLTKK